MGKRHRALVLELGQAVQSLLFEFNRDLNVVLARGIRRMFAAALEQYRRTLDERSVLDFSDVLERALELLRRMDEFAQSRFRLEARYHHVLVDEFQDTSRAQWELISLLIRSWGEGLGLASQPSIFIVGDRKQSIYRFRDAESGVLQDAARFIHALRPAGNPRRSIARSFRAVPELLQFVNELFAEIADRDPGAGRFTYTDSDRFPPLPASASGFGEISPERLRREGGPDADGAAIGAASRRFTLGAIASDDPDACARRRCRRDCANPSRRHGPRPQDRRGAAGGARAISPSSFDRARAIASSSASSRVAASRRMSTRVSGSSTPTRPRT